MLIWQHENTETIPARSKIGANACVLLQTWRGFFREKNAERRCLERKTSCLFFQVWLAEFVSRGGKAPVCAFSAEGAGLLIKDPDSMPSKPKGIFVIQDASASPMAWSAEVAELSQLSAPLMEMVRI